MAISVTPYPLKSCWRYLESKSGGHPDQAHPIAANPTKLPLSFFISYGSAFTSQILKYCLKPIRFFDSEKEEGTPNSISLEK